MLGVQRRSNEARREISVPGIHSTPPGWKVSWNWIKFILWYHRRYRVVSLEKFLPDRFSSVHRILGDGYPLCNKRGYNQKLSVRLWRFRIPNRDDFAKSCKDDREKHVEIFRSIWNQLCPEWIKKKNYFLLQKLTTQRIFTLFIWNRLINSNANYNYYLSLQFSLINSNFSKKKKKKK